MATLDHFESRDDLLQPLHASSRMPYLTGAKPLKHRGKRFWDAGIIDPFAVKTALADGCTHVLVLLSRPTGLPRRRLNLIERRVILSHIRRYSRRLADLFRHRFEPGQNGMLELDCSMEESANPPYLFGITLSTSDPDVHRMETKRERLIAGAAAGATAVLRTFGIQPAYAIETVRVFDEHGQAISAKYWGDHVQF